MLIIIELPGTLSTMFLLTEYLLLIDAPVDKHSTLPRAIMKKI